ncbi:hypothetical protein Aau02nite_24230 [Amorphoplanes auranticolor]|uniref:Uncharacterized protein n=1 Tax=Actinoplanes auranticolor TaxID=47988 RepID=A0A919S8K6_9ACTN|nr:hypothetical protein Aau02nite_24230 [Actinoplanes auranticolor]
MTAADAGAADTIPAASVAPARDSRKRQRKDMSDSWIARAPEPTNDQPRSGVCVMVSHVRREFGARRVSGGECGGVGALPERDRAIKRCARWGYDPVAAVSADSMADLKSGPAPSWASSTFAAL